ncbi:MAG: bifunctional riboflavin kinase/FAD synthetase [Taibaiella sp.]|nr:bifunctional riboflavin kinase/FAD synthetase [Taibaiella sp.]
MAVYFDIDYLPAFHNAVITTGFFDGVHQGHKAILQQVVTHAEKINGESVLITFEPHPRKLLFPEQPIKLITPLAPKLHYLAQAGIQHVVVVPFTRQFADLSADEYIEDFLVKKFHPRSIIIGYDHHFGHDRKGNISLLKQYQSTYSYEVVEIPAQLIDEATVSSTKIRKALDNGSVADAAHMLGRYYSIRGIVIKGKQLGRTLGYPTANILALSDEYIIPARGIYAVRVIHDGMQYGGMMSIGYNPTVTDEKTIRLEVNIFNFDKDIYDEEIEIQFIAWLRNEEKFTSLDELTKQLEKDKVNNIDILSKIV